MKGVRLREGGRIDRARPVTFQFNGRSYRGYEGDTLASALLANGVSLVARSWKYHRPRGVLSAGAEEPNALVQLFEGPRSVPNARMTEITLVEGLVARSVHSSPSVEFDLRAINALFSRLMPVGFYYKTFMASQRVWHFFERHIRAASGLGTSPNTPDPDVYEKRYSHCDVLVVGAGIAGLSAALSAGASGARVIFCDEQSEPGGWLLSSDETIDRQPAGEWIAQALRQLAQMTEVQVLRRTVAFGFHDQNYLVLSEHLTDHLRSGGVGPRERLWRVRAKQVVLATGAHERPLVFANNDLPGIMLASAVSTYIRRFAAVPGSAAVVFTNNDDAYDAAFALHDANVPVKVVDVRPAPSGHIVDRARKAKIEILAGWVITEARGWRRVRSVDVETVDASGCLTGNRRVLAANLVAMSGGFSPVIHLQSQSGAKAHWDDQAAAFLPGRPVQEERSAGASRGLRDLRACAVDGAAAGAAAAEAIGFSAVLRPAPELKARDQGQPIEPLWIVRHRRAGGRAPKQFVDFQNDVTAADIELAVREGFESIEHVKRYTAMGFGTDQGKTANINGMGIVAKALGKPLADVGTTTFRPNYTPVTFGALAGIELGQLFEPVRKTSLHSWHVEQGALFEDVGQWKRPWYYPRLGETLHEAVRREVLAVRHAVGILDASTLGKIDIQGPDASVLLNWVYSNAWSKLEVGKCRYGLMLDENGMVFDDGVTVRLSENHYLMHTTTGGAARVLAWLERWLQTEWPHLKIYLTSVTDHWATTAVAGPRSRDLLRTLCKDVDFEDDAFPFMSWRPGSVAGVAARLMRISFSGERCYEVNVASGKGVEVWQAIHAAGRPFGIAPYGTEAMHVLRGEKGYIIVGQDTDGSMTPHDLGMSGLVAKTKDFIGKRSLSRSDTARLDRKQLVGLLTDDPRMVLPEGAQILDEPTNVIPARMVGHVTSSYDSPTLDRSIALAVVTRGLQRMGEKVYLPFADGQIAAATIVSPVFFDPRAERQHA